jgi:hypothetical protein
MPALPLLACGLGLAFVPNLAGHAIAYAGRLLNRAAHAHEVLHAVAPPASSNPSYEPSTAAYAWGAVATVGSLGFAALGLYRQRLPQLARRALGPPAHVLQALHSGAVGDYVTWFVVGAAVLGGLVAVVVR